MFQWRLGRSDEELGAVGIRSSIRHGDEALVRELHPQVLPSSARTHGTAMAIHPLASHVQCLQLTSNPAALPLDHDVQHNAATVKRVGELNI